MMPLTESELDAHLQRLAVDIGARPVGSPANRAAGGYIAAVFRQSGLQVEELSFDCPQWTHVETVLEVGGERLDARANMWSLPCAITAPLVPLCALAELEQADLAGKIGVLYGDLAQAPLTPMNYAVYQIERDQRINALLEAKHPAAVITINQRPGALERLIEDKDLTVPSATVGAQAGLRLLAHPARTAHLRIVTRRENGSGAHIIGTRSGKRPERLVLCAHFDSKIDTPGAWDNASGVSVLLALARLLTHNQIGLEFVAFNDEEYLGNDNAVYMGQRGHLLDSALAAINIDGVGQRLGTTSIMITAASSAFATLAADVTAHYPAVTWVDPYPQSSHSLFAFRGVPALAVSSSPFSPFYHLDADTVEWLSAAKLVEATALVADLVAAVQDKPLAWVRPPAEE